MTSRWPLDLLSAFVAMNQWMYVVAEFCPPSLVLGRAGVEPRCPS